MNKDLSIRQYIAHASTIIMLLCGLIFICLSCTEIAIGVEEPATDSSVATGKDGNLNFVLNFDDYGEGESNPTTRSAADLEAETVVVPLSDGLSMLATLEPVRKEVNSRPVELRSFTLNTRIYIVAFKQSAVPTVYNYEHHVGFRVEISAMNSSLMREGWTPFSLDVGDTYRFVAYSYNDDSTPLPAVVFPTSMNITDIHPGLDLIWGESVDVTIATGDNQITIPMKHLFSKVRIDALSSGVGNVTNLSDVKMYGNTAELDVETGILTAFADSTMLFTDFTPYNTDSVSSTPRIVYTAGANTTVVNIGNMIVGGNTYTDLTATFARQLLSGYEYHLKMRIGDSDKLSDDLPPTGFIPYVGAFWKYDQKGERLIRMARSSNYTTADGVWTATVVKGADWIVLDTVRSTDNNVWMSTGPTLSGNDAGFESTHFLPGNSIYVNGIMSASQPEIYFRIGLKSTLSNPADNRYGIVLLTYANNTKRQRIFIRQGEAADYLMRPEDNNRNTAAMRFSPYNLTVPSGQTWDIGAHGVELPIKGGEFVDYPTQSGAFFQWVNTGAGANNRTRFAWDPFTPLGAGLSPSWNTTYPNPSSDPWYWQGQANFAATHETCPPGYRRPNDGSTIGAAVNNLDVSASEFRQSLWFAPQTGVLDNSKNSIWGYYADGFFDRRQIVSGPPLAISSGLNSTVSNTDKNMAHIGRLFYHPDNYASLFFPAAGFRGGAPSEIGTLSDAGYLGYYWSSSANGAAPWYLYLSSISSNMNYSYPSDGYSIRCVVDNTPFLTPNPSSLTFAYNAPSGQNVTVTTNQGSWSAVSSDSWCTLSTSSGTSGQSFTVTCNTNGGFVPRSATITVIAGGLTEYVTVTQMPTLSLNVSPTSLTFANTANGSSSSQNVAVTTNVLSWTYTVTGTNAANFSVTKSGDNLIVYPTSANSSATARTATITVTAGDLTRTVSVTQNPTTTNVSPANVSLTWSAHNPATQAVTVTSNGPWTLTSNQTWLRLNTNGSANGTASVSGTGNMTVYLVADMHTVTTSRQAQLYLNGVTTDVRVTITQAAFPYVACGGYWLAPSNPNATVRAITSGTAPCPAGTRLPNTQAEAEALAAANCYANMSAMSFIAFNQNWTSGQFWLKYKDGIPATWRWRQSGWSAYELDYSTNYRCIYSAISP